MPQALSLLLACGFLPARAGATIVVMPVDAATVRRTIAVCER